MADIVDKPPEADMADRLTTFQPRECSTEGGESLVITFSKPLPNDPMVIILNGSEVTHKLQPERIDDHVLAALLPAHSLPEPVQFTVYWLPSSEEHSSTYRAIPLMEGVIQYTDETRLLAEQLVLSVVDATQSAIFYSLLPPLASMNITMSCEFDAKLTDALKNVKMPKNWNMVTPGHDHQETLLHFASKNNLPHLFSLLLTLPGGKEAVMVANKQGKHPIDLAKESGSHEITRIIEGLERESSPFASVGANVTVPSLSLPDTRSSPYLNIMKEIDDIWISKQKQHKNGLNIASPPPKRGSTTNNHYTKRPNSIAVMEGLNSLDDNSTLCCWLCVKEKCRKKSWSRVVGESITRSVDTGMNELDRITDQILAHERLQDVRNMKNTAVKGEWLHKLSFSCPVLNDEVDSVSNNLIHSTLTSPGLFDGPAFSSAFSAPAYFKSNSDPLDSIPHQSLDTINTDNGGAHSTSPYNMAVPQVCIEDEQHPGVCLPPPNDEGGDDSTLKADGRQSPYQYCSDSGDSDDDQDQEDDDVDDGFVHIECPEDVPPENPLSSKSAPTLQTVQASIGPTQLAMPHKFNKSISTADTVNVLKVVNSKSPPSGGQISEEEFSDDDNMKTKSAVCLTSSPPSSPVKKRTTPTEITPTHEKTHQKSHSVSGIRLNTDMLEETSDQLLSPLPVPLLTDDCRSRGSSFISTSSKPDDTTDTEDSDDEEDDFEPPQSANNAMLLGLKKITRKEDEVVSSEDDYLDGEDKRSNSRGRMGRRMSEVKVTMIDEVSDDDVTTTRPLPRSSTADDALSHSAHSGEDRRSSTPHSYSPGPHKNNEIQLSDINVSVESLNNSFSGDNSKTVLPPQANMSPIFKRGASKSFTPSDSPKVLEQSKRFSDPKLTVKHLQSLLKLEIDQEDPSAFSDDSDLEASGGKQRRRSADKSQTLPIDSPPSQMRGRSPLLSQSDLKPHAKVVRNSSTASDTKVSYKREPECSSLDFVKPPDGQSSPRGQHSPFQCDSYTVNPPQSPLFFSKRSPIGDERPSIEGLLSPKGQGSPMEKRISRSADNLLSDPPKGDEKEDKQKQSQESPSKNAKKKEESNNVRLLRFQQLPNDETHTDEETNSQHKDVSKYYGIEQEKEQTKKPAFKLFRRDSKKEKKPKKVESGFSLDSGTNNGGQMKNAKKTQPSPILRKQRANTVHGDLNYAQLPQPQPPEESITKSQQYSFTSKRVSQTSNSSIPPRDSISPVREESLSPPPTSPTSNHSQFTFDEYPELMPSEEADLSWNRTVDRRLRKQMSKHEKGRQGVIYDWITTERHICRTFIILKKLFYNRLQFELKMSEEELNQLFPSVTTLLAISKDFVTRLQDRQKQSGALIQDISDILLDQFTGAKGEAMKKAYTHFICLYPSTMEYYREMGKRRHFTRVISMIYQDKVLERKKLPDFYLLITQRVSKYVEMMKKLVKETEALKLDHLVRVRESSVALTELVNSIDRGVYEYTSTKELTDIQNRMEISVSKSAGKNRKLKDIKLLDFTAQNRFLLKRGDATWQGQLGQGRQTAVHVVLVTDFLVLLTERDQKYHLATLHDIQPPVIKLYDLHVRVNAAVKSGVQLLLVDQGELPEIFRVEFTHKKLAKEWEEALNTAIGYCKENGLKCEYFGAEPVLSGEENNKEEEEERPDSGGDSSNLSPSSYRRFIISMALEQANSILSSTGPTSSGTFGGSMMTIDEVRDSPKPVLKSSNKAQRSNTQRTVSVDETGKRKNKKQVERGKSFLDKKVNEDQAMEKQAMIECISKLKESLELVMEQNEEQDKIIQKLKKELDDYKLSDNSSNSPATPRSQRGSSFSRTRPHSLHSDLFEANNCAVK